MYSGKQKSKHKKSILLPVLLGLLGLTAAIALMVLLVAVALHKQDQLLYRSVFEKVEDTTNQVEAEVPGDGLDWEKIDPAKEQTEPDSLLSGNLAEEAVENDLLGNADTGEVTLLFAGDILFDDSYTVMAMLRQRSGGIIDCFSKDLLEEMRAADLFMLNNEFPYSDRGEPTVDKQYTFRAKPENAKLLKEIGVDLVSLANNHTFDHGQIAFEDTLSTLEKEAIPQVGAGRNIEEAKAAYYVQTTAGTISVIAATQIERQPNPDTKGATKNSPGTLRCWTDGELENLLGAIQTAKENSDFTVVYIHWGTESTTELDWAQTTQAEKIAEAGADLIIGDHPHVLQQIASVKEVPIIYSLGNFWFNSGTCDTGLVKVTLKNKKITSFQFLPAEQKSCVTSMLSGAEKQRVLTDMQNLSTSVIIDNDGYVQFK